MKRVFILKNTIQPYAWGSHTAIPELLGNAPDNTPQAELWLGAHPKAPSETEIAPGDWRRLDHVIAENPEAILGRETAARFGGQLPCLFKVLAAAEPLSIQAHPDQDQARKGFARENRLGIPLNAPHRNYRDDSHKPECICALTRFHALNGFRPVPEILDLCRKACPQSLGYFLDKLARKPDAAGVQEFFRSLMSLSSEDRSKAVDEALSFALHQPEDNPVSRWLIRLHRFYPADTGVLAPLFLNLICLEPGQAMFLPARRLHSYLDGTGIEHMANSDNVLRGGLTPKHVDLPELLRVLDFTPEPVKILIPRQTGLHEWTYPSWADEFVLSVIRPDDTPEILSNRSVSLLLCTDGHAVMEVPESGQVLEIMKGRSVLIPAAVSECRITGHACIYRASIPA